MSRHAAVKPRVRVLDFMGATRVRALLGLAALLVLATPGTYAHWTDEVQISGTTVTTGTIDLRVDGQDQITGYATLDLAGMVPGNSTAAVLTIRNNGTAPLKYTATTSASNPDGQGLGGAMGVKVTDDTTATGTAPATTCPGATLPDTSAALNGALISTGRLLAPNTTTKICVQITLPTNAAPGLQGATTSVTFALTGTSDMS